MAKAGDHPSGTVAGPPFRLVVGGGLGPSWGEWRSLLFRVAHRVGDNLLPYSVEPFVTRAKERLGSMPERYVPVIKGALDSLGAGE